MSPRLTTFSKLTEIKIRSCSMVEWGGDATLTTGAHPLIQNLYASMTNMSGIPEGLLSPDFPSQLNDIEFCGTNLTELSIELFERWSKVLFFYLELSPGIIEFPPALLRTTNSSLLYLSLSSNSITFLPEDVFTGHQYELFLASGNLLTKLPEEVGTATAISNLAITHTGIAEIPES